MLCNVDEKSHIDAIYKLSDFFKHILAYPANRAAPVVRKVLKCCTRSNATVRITLLRVIDISAGAALILRRIAGI